MQLIRRTTSCDVARIVAIARAAYIKYVPRIGREPPPMLADFPAEIAAGHVVVLEMSGTVEGYLIAWPKIDAYFVDNIAVDPAHQGLGLGPGLHVSNSCLKLPKFCSSRARLGPGSGHFFLACMCHCGSIPRYGLIFETASSYQL
jgi:GNAT superfamily N-acetyltransferase